MSTCNACPIAGFCWMFWHIRFPFALFWSLGSTSILQFGFGVKGGVDKECCTFLEVVILSLAKLYWDDIGWSWCSSKLKDFFSAGDVSGDSKIGFASTGFLRLDSTFAIFGCSDTFYQDSNSILEFLLAPLCKATKGTLLQSASFPSILKQAAVYYRRHRYTQ